MAATIPVHNIQFTINQHLADDQETEHYSEANGRPKHPWAVWRDPEETYAQLYRLQKERP